MAYDEEHAGIPYELKILIAIPVIIVFTGLMIASWNYFDYINRPHEPDNYHTYISVPVKLTYIKNTLFGDVRVCVFESPDTHQRYELDDCRYGEGELITLHPGYTHDWVLNGTEVAAH